MRLGETRRVKKLAVAKVEVIHILAVELIGLEQLKITKQYVLDV